VRIAHAHTCDEPETIKVKLARVFCTFITKMVATDLFACGEEAGRWVWGDLKTNGVFVMHNAIQTGDFEYDESERDAIRKKLAIDDKFVIGSIGRFCPQKNQMFLLEVFEQVSCDRPNAVLALVGGGEDEVTLKEFVGLKKLEDKVLFLGVRNDVNKLINAFDLFVLPSRYEGLPVTLVEVQVNGLTALVSKNITPEIKINDNIEYISLLKEKWVNAMTFASNNRDMFGREKVVAAGYDIAVESCVLIDKYKGLID